MDTLRDTNDPAWEKRSGETTSSAAGTETNETAAGFGIRQAAHAAETREAGILSGKHSK